MQVYVPNLRYLHFYMYFCACEFVFGNFIRLMFNIQTCKSMFEISGICIFLCVFVYLYLANSSVLQCPKMQISTTTLMIIVTYVIIIAIMIIVILIANEDDYFQLRRNQNPGSTVNSCNLQLSE